MTLTLLQWNTTYNSRNTRPLNNVKQSFWGLPERVNHPDFIAVYGNDPANCQYPNFDVGYDEQETEYCNAVGCALRNSCNFYQLVTHGYTVEDEVRRDPQGREISITERFDPALIEQDLPLPDELGNNIHGGEQLTEEQIIEGIIRQQGTIVPINNEQ